MEFPAPFFFANKRLTNHTIKVIGILDMDLCELMCYQEPNCVSINFRKKPENGGVKHRCELNNSTLNYATVVVIKHMNIPILRKWPIYSLELNH